MESNSHPIQLVRGFINFKSKRLILRIRQLLKLTYMYKLHVKLHKFHEMISKIVGRVCRLPASNEITAWYAIMAAVRPSEIIMVNNFWK